MGIVTTALAVVGFIGTLLLNQRMLAGGPFKSLPRWQRERRWIGYGMQDMRLTAAVVLGAGFLPLSLLVLLSGDGVGQFTTRFMWYGACNICLILTSRHVAAWFGMRRLLREHHAD